MSRSRRQRDAVAPSLFPFLAVLLCTMGALVLILMLIVAGAQASAQQIAKVAEEQVEEVESQLQLASYAYEKQLTQGRLELEKKRLALQHLEQHIQELLAELEQVQRTAELAREEAANDEASKAAQAEALSQLEKQLLEAQEALRQKLDKPQGDKPIFAIIPYDGPNGTHRRPIYLECLETGIKIQPEGVLLQLDDLQPPYGPGNPLDAALRTIRTQYVPANHALTSTAYPLLVVRPSGIRTYAMARAAMSGWDDQFGYELIGEDLELSFPQGEPGLKNKIVQAVELARQRQAALVMAMPKKYRRLSELPDGPLEGGGSAGNYDGMAGGNGEYSSQEHHPANGPGSDSWLPGGAADGNRGGFSLDGSGAGNGSSSPNSTAQLGFGHGPMDQSAGNTGGGESLFGSEHQGSSLAFGQLAGTAGDGQANSTLFPTGGSATAGQGGSGGATNGSGGTAASDPYGPSDNPNEISSRRSSGSGSSSNGPSNSNASGGTSGSGSAAQAMNSSGSQI
ncbi:MAG: hypothetical protein KDA45_09795, partial [Planctomycetales bacterium]|nr:hypothetical protein [Planctomycetales bacterium]